MTFSQDSKTPKITVEDKFTNAPYDILHLIKESWNVIAPFWPLKNLIAVNPLQGLEMLPIEDAIEEGAVLFQHTELPEPMASINRQSIKWLQAFFDEGQATIGMPLRTHGFYISWKKLAYFDTEIHGGDIEKKKWLLALSNNPEITTSECFLKLNIPKEDAGLFLTLMLTTLPGWASHVKYRTHWTQGESPHAYRVSEADYTAFRLVITTLLWEDAKSLLQWYRQLKSLPKKKPHPIEAVLKAETDYLTPLLNKLNVQTLKKFSKHLHAPDAQLVFCIDVRSEPFRRALERIGQYETFGFSGFFGLPVRIHNTIKNELYSSCPALLSPEYTVKEVPLCGHLSQKAYEHYQRFNTIKALYQCMKYNFITSFALVELFGFITAFWMALKTLAPVFTIKFYTYLMKKIRPTLIITPSLENISFKDQCTYGELALRGMGLTKNFASLVVFCGHASTTHNNIYATMLDCGACGGRHGGHNARILAKILNTKKVRTQLNKVGISIPSSTHFIAAEHNTTQDILEIYQTDTGDLPSEELLKRLKKDLKKAGAINSHKRCKAMEFSGNKHSSAQHTTRRSVDWAQVRPEWGLAGNASFIVAPRELTQKLDLEGRAFLHSYDYLQDPKGTVLKVILTAPMVVAQWINSQYLFSTLDNVAYGSGSKITQNVTGKIGVMQGNASDLMTGLSLQSVYKTDTTPYHTPVRLMTIIYAPRRIIDEIIETQPVLQTLFRNGWVRVACIDPEDGNHNYFLHRDLIWRINS